MHIQLIVKYIEIWLDAHFTRNLNTDVTDSLFEPFQKDKIFKGAQKTADELNMHLQLHIFKMIYNEVFRIICSLSILKVRESYLDFAQRNILHTSIRGINFY